MGMISMIDFGIYTEKHSMKKFPQKKVKEPWKLDETEIHENSLKRTHLWGIQHKHLEYRVKINEHKSKNKLKLIWFKRNTNRKESPNHICENYQKLLKYERTK